MLYFELDGWDESDLAVEASVVEPVDVFRDGDLEVVDALPGALVADELGFEQRVERLSQGVEAPMSSSLPEGLVAA